ncbi:MAG: NAD-dependent epimerase/dehydratase family protein [Clostridia bacterium]
MKKVLITGANSYIGTSFEKYVSQNDSFLVDTIDMIDGSWENSDFSEYDTVFHVAGIAHSDSGKISEEKAKLYYSVNTDLTEKVAIKCKKDGVSQFIYMSSMIVYGASSKMGEIKMIDDKTVPKPENAYGDSKLQAEIKLNRLVDDSFKVVILRPPMIYGKGSKGNYPVLSKYAKKLPIFPNVDNQRSMLYIENLCEFIKLMVENEEQGTFMPQNSSYTKTSEMVKVIADVSGNNIILTRIFNLPLRLISPIVGVVNKVFGSLAYDMSISEYEKEYRVVGFNESIKRTER